MNKRQQLDTLSRNLFFSGLIIARFSAIRIPIIAHASFLLAALCYVAGYAVWQASVNEVNYARSYILEKYKAKFEREYLHMPQYSIAAILGIVASIALIGSLFMPQTLGLVSAWLFFSSNFFWWWAEDINIKRLRTDKSGSAEHEARETYYTYTNLSTLNSAVYAISLLIYLIVPATTLPLGFVVSTTLLASTLHTFHYWLKSAYANSMLTESDMDEDIIVLSELTIENSYKKLQTRSDFITVPHSNCDSKKLEVKPTNPLDIDDKMSIFEPISNAL